MMRRITPWIILLLLAISLVVDLPTVLPERFLTNLPLAKTIAQKFPLKLGLDLQGGTQLVLQAQMDKISPNERDNALISAKEIIERRVNLFGVSEAVVQTSKLGQQQRILVELPGVKDSSVAAELVGKTAQLDFREIPPDTSPEASSSALLAAILQAKPTGLTGADLKRASVTFGTSAGQSGPQVSLEFSAEGARKFAEITRRNIGKPLPIFLDGQPIEAPTVKQEITDGNAVITGQFTTEQAKTIATQLNAGALPVPVKIISSLHIGPSLGESSLNKSLIAGTIGLGIVTLYMIAFYGWWGILADLSLLLYTLIVFAIFKTGGFILPPITLTLAGIAGFILSIGMAVDANILIFERMKEELRWGKSKTVALELGFTRAWSSIWASNTSSLMTAVILYYFGTSIVRGFAITLAIGVLVSMFTAIVVTKTLLRLFIK
ncbi:MAG: protein translocase subunit SecD [Candidatus Daviesbacteria bacterium]|nr:MAG: protein translocase subunit SecD [Candidatus Daviesbacteria bacterium]